MGEAMLLLHADLVEIESLEALERRHVTLDERTLSHTGIADLTIRADWADLVDFDTTVTRVADALKRDGSLESHDVRRSQAVGILADPTRALALLNDTEPTGPVEEHRGLPPPDPGHHRGPRAPRPRRARPHPPRHHRPGVARPHRPPRHHPPRHQPQRPLPRRHGRRPRRASDPYVAAFTTAEKVRLRNPVCVFPHCTKRSRSCDLDHLDRPRTIRDHVRVQPRPTLPTSPPAQDPRRLAISTTHPRHVPLARTPRPDPPHHPHRHHRPHRPLSGSFRSASEGLRSSSGLGNKPRPPTVEPGERT